MVLLELATYFFGAVVSLVVAVFLFGVKIKSKGEGSFYRVKRLLATCASGMVLIICCLTNSWCL